MLHATNLIIQNKFINTSPSINIIETLDIHFNFLLIPSGDAHVFFDLEGRHILLLNFS